MIRRFAVLVCVAAITMTAAWGQGGVRDYAPLSLNVACGSFAKAPCASVVPKLAARTAQSGVDLKPVESGGQLDAAAAVCDGRAGFAIVQRDAIDLVRQTTACQNSFGPVGHALYPTYAFLVVKAGSPIRQFDDLVRLGQEGHQRAVAAGPAGSGGQVTLGYLLRASPPRLLAIVAMEDDIDTALPRVADGSIDAVFAVDTLDSVLLDRVRTMKDAHGKAVFAFADVRPEKDFLKTADSTGHCLYRLTALDFGVAAPVTTLSIDAVMLSGRASADAHARGGPRASDAVNAAIDAVQPAILADMKSPRDWRPAAASCH